ncbi:FAD synthase [Condylostylus longicornis]|uniref:FAD synthase n=1 Tax=Condylostylus longicornis TaxID=2530218 RepID=UPI00244E0A59|nr:FAD synthase [Condylostylus longicornis]
MTHTSHSTESESSTDLQHKIHQVYEIFTKTFAAYSMDQVFLSFNGGKDCTVLLDLLYKYLKTQPLIHNKNIRIIYIQPTEPFEEVEDFVDKCTKTYNVFIEKRQGKLKNILEEVCEDKSLKAVIMGCRRTDPHCENLDYMQLTDPNWPILMRVNPLLFWTCEDIWNYILTFNVPFCSLYNHGYTSLGDRSNTKPNPHLKIVNPVTGEITFRPAYELTRDELERAGRNK